MLRHICKICLALLLIQSSLIFASSISPKDSQIRFISNSGYPSDFLHIATPSTEGISVNRFNTFSVSGKPLHILNPGSADLRPTTIVIIADSIVLQDTIEIVGDASDIVFISPKSSGQIACTNCVFKNNYRVTLAVTNDEPSITGSSLGEFNTAGKILINGLLSPGAINVDLLAEQIATQGTLSLHQAVNKDTSGGYVSVDTGSLSMGSGTLQLITGSSGWDYDAQVLVGNAPSSEVSNISGSFRSVGVKINSASVIDIDANIDTTTDALATVRYRGNVKVSQESVQINDFSNSSPSLDYLNVYSNGIVAINTMNRLTIPSSASIVGRETSLIADKELYHYGETSGYLLSLAASNVLNEGLLTAEATLEAWADNWIINRSGGEIQGDIVSLETSDQVDSFVSNGSRTPYELTPTSLLNIDENYFDRIDHTKIGTYYLAGLHEVENFSGYSKPAKTSAHILARRISVVTQAFENINPYYEFVDELGEDLVVQRSLINQVSVIAEDNLEIDAARYILNSSALLGSEKANSKTHLQTNALSNERYRVLAMLDLDYYSDSGDYIDTGQWENGEPVGYVQTTDTENIRTKMATFSPPGVVYSMGTFEFSSANNTSTNPTGLFLNAIGYLEVFGDAKFNTANVIDAGLENQEITRNETFRTYNIGRSRAVSDDYIASPQEIDSLFYVGGIARAAQTDTSHFFNFSPFKGYLKMVLDRLMENYDFVGTGSSLPNIPASSQIIGNLDSDLSTSLVFDIDTQLSDLPDEFTISWFEALTYIPHSPGTFAEDRTVVSRGEDTYSIFDELKKLFNDLVDSFIEIFNELKWW